MRDVIQTRAIEHRRSKVYRQACAEANVSPPLAAIETTVLFQQDGMGVRGDEHDEDAGGGGNTSHV